MRVWCACSCLLAATGCSVAEPDHERIATQAEAIVDGSPALQYPEAVYVTSDGYVPCSGVLLTPTVVLSAGHCRGRESTYEVVAPNANGQSAHGSSSGSRTTRRRRYFVALLGRMQLGDG